MTSIGQLGVNLKWWDGSKWRPDAIVPSGAVIAAGASATTTSIASSTYRAQPSTNFTVSGVVSPNPGGGTVQVYRNGVGYGVAVAVNPSTGAWSYTTAQITGSSTFYAAFSGFGGFSASTSGTITVAAKVLNTYTLTYACTSTQSYNGDGTQRNDDAHIYQGYVSSVHDQQKCFIRFSTIIQTDLAGAYDITNVEVYLNALHWGPDSGGTARIRTCNNTTAPSTWSGITSLSSNSDTSWTTKTGAKWCALSAGVRGTLADWQAGGTKKGIALWANSNATEYYGYFAGNGESGEPQLRITYRIYE
jgi:hypothetical protein